MIKITYTLFFIAILFASHLEAATVIERHAITWTFAEEENCGVYANGDPWCVGPVTITNIEPLSTDISGRIQHGSMLNPVGYSSGYDSNQNWKYTPSLNVARPNGNTLSIENSLTISSGSLVSARTYNTANTRPGITDASVLTIVESAPTVGSFRPPLSGVDKTSHWNISDIKWDLLPRLDRSKLSKVYTTTGTLNSMSSLWLDVQGGISTGREFHPSNNMPDYGGSMAVILNNAQLMLMLDFDQTVLDPLMITFLQYGIDIYGSIKNYPVDILRASTQGGVWAGGGGHGLGRKWPVLFAGLMLGDPDILKYADGERYPIFQEEQQTFYITQVDVARARYTSDGRPRSPYTAAMIGIPEWGEQHRNAAQRDGSNWNAYYRDVASPTYTGSALAALIMGQKNTWNWPSFFEYADRYAQHIKDANLPLNSYSSAFTRDMWETFRQDYPPVWVLGATPSVVTKGSHSTGTASVKSGTGKWSN